MIDSPLSSKTVYIAVFVSFSILVFIYIGNVFDQNTKIIFCDVGQGDAAYIRIKNRVDILIDAGPDQSVLKCLGSYMPFYDKTSEVAIITHPQKDHYYGLTYLLDRYRVDMIIMNPLDHEGEQFNGFKKKIIQENTQLFFPTNKTRLTILQDRIDFYWPTEDFLNRTIPSRSRKQLYTSPLSLEDVLGESTVDPNEFSLIFSLNEGSIKALFTGDASQNIFDYLQENKDLKSTILKVPHHGSAKGLTRSFLYSVDPKVSIISVGKKNRYGHPSKKITEMLDLFNRPYWRTDKDGSIGFQLVDGELKKMTR